MRWRNVWGSAMELIETGRTRDFAAAIADPARAWRPMTSVESGDRALAQPRARVEGVGIALRGLEGKSSSRARVAIPDLGRISRPSFHPAPRAWLPRKLVDGSD